MKAAPKRRCLTTWVTKNNEARRWEDENEGGFRLSFFYGNRRARLSVDVSGRILRRSTVDFGLRPIRAPMRKPGG
ncbi:DUF6522 family protein [Afipia birgiae]|uniref:DUF6522 family protein n=1 Tax=Afipia birgiae TaxID=151414 RepID=UPI001FCCB152|nr:DUF6522 family protein [Afipia birgiae]MBX9822117.1 hypothetical protein [Afipia birgiae]